MSIAVAERLKSELTDRYVVVAKGVPELRRFVGLTGRVKTVNMNGRALVEFDGPEDISWYDIEPSYLTVVEAPLPKEQAAEPASKAESKPAPAPAAPAGKSPLELAREQAAGKGDESPAKALSPLERARQEGAGSASNDESPAADAPTPPAGDEPEEDLSKLSPIEQLRRQGSKRK